MISTPSRLRFTHIGGCLARLGSRLVAEQSTGTAGAGPGPIGLRGALAHWHGEIIEGRSVGNLELFYDLVFVVLIARISHTLVEHLTLRGVAEFAILFALIMAAWQNGSMFHDLHARDDGRGRNIIFAEMTVLVVMSTFIGHAYGEDGRAFAWVYAGLFTLIAVQWWRVRLLDEERYRQLTGQYLAGMIAMIGLMVLSANVGADLRFWIWLGVALLYSLGAAGQVLMNRNFDEIGFHVTHAFTERMGLFVIIVLGETVAGVANGLLEADPRTLMTFVVGALTLQVAFGFWWTYFDTTRSLPPRRTVRSTPMWILLHLPLTGGIAAAGAGMVGLVGHATAEHPPVAAARLLGGAGALVLLATALIGLTLDDPRLAVIRRPATATLAGGAAAFVVVGLIPMAPWLTALLLGLIGLVCWFGLFALVATRAEWEQA